MSSSGHWPPPLDELGSPPDAEIAKARIEVAKKRDESYAARAKADADAETALNKAYYDAIFEVGKGGLQRSRDAATTVQTAAGAIVTLYTGLLAGVFAADGTPLPPRGVAPALLLGLAIVLSTFYVAFLGRAGGRWVAGPQASSSSRVMQQRRTWTFLSWMRESIRRRSYFLRASVLALGFGVMLLPAPFLSVGHVDLGPLGAYGEAGKPAAETVEWPGTPAETSEPRLQKILYAAQVKEAAEGRSAGAPARSGADGFWFLLAGVAVLLSALLAWLGGRGEEAAPRPDSLPTTESQPA